MSSSDTKALASIFRRKARLYIHDATTQEGNPAHAGLKELVQAYPYYLSEKKCCWRLTMTISIFTWNTSKLIKFW